MREMKGTLTVLSAMPLTLQRRLGLMSTDSLEVGDTQVLPHMILLEWTLALLLGAVLLAALARRIGLPSPALLALGGVTLAFFPVGPRLFLNPALAAALF